MLVRPQAMDPQEDLIMPPIRPELLDELLKDYQKPEDLLCWALFRHFSRKNY